MLATFRNSPILMRSWACLSYGLRSGIYDEMEETGLYNAISARNSSTASSILCATSPRPSETVCVVF